jgi:hypothetical protein
MPDILPRIAEIDDRIAAVRENLRELVEQAAAYSGAAGRNASTSSRRFSNS